MMTKVDREKQIRIENELDNLLFEVMEAVQSPEKWSIDAITGAMREVYPHPVLDSWHRVKKVAYKPFKYDMEAQLHEALLERYHQLQKDINQADPNNYIKKKEDRKSYVKVTPEMAEQIVQLYQDGVTRLDIALELGLSKSAVNTHIKKALGSQKKEPVKHPEQDIQDWAEFYELGFTYSEIAQAYEVTESTVNYHSKRIGAENKSAGRASKYPKELIAEWNTLKDSGATYEAIAEVYKVPKANVKYHVTRYRQDRTVNPKPKKMEG